MKYARKSSEKIKLTAKEFPHHAKDHFWYVGIVLLSVSLLIFTINIHQYLLSAVVVALSLAILSMANVKPSTKNVQIDEKGFSWGSQFYAYHQLKAFWIGINDRHIMFYLERLNFNPLISFVVTEDQAEKIVDVLSGHLPFHDHKGEPLPEQLNRLLHL